MNWPSFIFWLPLLFEILGNMCIAIVYWPGYDVMNFEVILVFMIKTFFLNDQKEKKKKLSILRTKSSFKVKQKAFFIIFKGLSIKKIMQYFWGGGGDGESTTLNQQVNKGWYTYDVHFERGGRLRQEWDVIGRKGGGGR